MSSPQLLNVGHAGHFWSQKRDGEANFDNVNHGQVPLKTTFPKHKPFPV